MWDALGKAYYLNRREEGNSGEAWLAALSTYVLDKASEREDLANSRKLAVTNARQAFAGRTTQRHQTPL
jgi:hypothetical protein